MPTKAPTEDAVADRACGPADERACAHRPGGHAPEQRAGSGRLERRTGTGLHRSEHNKPCNTENRPQIGVFCRLCTITRRARGADPRQRRERRDAWAPVLPALEERFEVVAPNRGGYPPGPLLERIDFERQAEELAPLLGERRAPRRPLLRRRDRAPDRGRAPGARPLAGGQRAAGLRARAREPGGGRPGRAHRGALRARAARAARLRRRLPRAGRQRDAAARAALAGLEQGIRATMAERLPSEAEIPLDELAATPFPKLVDLRRAPPRLRRGLRRARDERSARNGRSCPAPATASRALPATPSGSLRVPRRFGLDRTVGALASAGMRCEADVAAAAALAGGAGACRAGARRRRRRPPERERARGPRGHRPLDGERAPPAPGRGRLPRRGRPGRNRYYELAGRRRGRGGGGALAHRAGAAGALAQGGDPRRAPARGADVLRPPGGAARGRARSRAGARRVVVRSNGGYALGESAAPELEPLGIDLERPRPSCGGRSSAAASTGASASSTSPARSGAAITARLFELDCLDRRDRTRSVALTEAGRVVFDELGV